MKTNVFLTSLLVIATASPAFAASTATEASWPNDGLMQENKIYKNAATLEHLGQNVLDTGRVTAEIIYAISVPEGKYLPKGVGSPSNLAYCPDGFYCPGNTTDGYLSSTTADQGMFKCPGTYVNSGTGATKEGDCYEDWSGETCENMPAGATSCTYPAGARRYKDGRTANMGVELECQPGYTQKFVSLFDTVGFNEDADSGAAKSEKTSSDLYKTEFGKLHVSDISVNGWVLEYEDVPDYGTVKVNGSARCAYSELQSNLESILNSQGTSWLDDSTISRMGPESGRYCFCRVNSVSINNGTSVDIGSEWALIATYTNMSDEDNCFGLCPKKCLNALKNGKNGTIRNYFREALFTSTPAKLGSECVGKTIQITWTDANPQDISANGAATCTFGGDITTPVKALTAPTGRIFRGWRFKK